MIDSIFLYEIIISLSFGFAMLVISVLGVVDIYFSSDEIMASVYGRIVLGGWIAIGAFGLFLMVLCCREAPSLCIFRSSAC